MFDTIILLTGPAEQAVLAPALTSCNPAINVVTAATREQLDDLDLATLRSARLIAFTTAVIVPRTILSAVGHGAFNFHPGPPEYPGWAPAHFALYEGAAEFGATFHVMTERVDAGAIIDAEFFPVVPSLNVTALAEMAYVYLGLLFRKWAVALATQPAPLQVRRPLQWGARKNSQRHYRALCDIPLDISKDDLARRMSAFGGNHFGVVPTINLHGVEFKAVAVPQD